MATLVSALETQVREHLNEDTASFWTSAELVSIFNNGIKDLWGMIVDLNQEHFLTIDTTLVSLAADGVTLTGVPADVFRVHLIEPVSTVAGATGANVLFEPADYNDYRFRNARMLTAQDPSGGLKIYYTLSQAGAPVAAPTVHVAPKVSTALSPLRFVYVPTLALVTTASNNPIPGESDNALIAYCVAFAKAKEREDNSPDPSWLNIYKTEKTNLSVRLTPRQTQEPDVVEDIFGAFM
jgi:hypothetical protein